MLVKNRKSPSALKPPALSREELETRLHEAEETIRAIRSGEVDAIVVDGPGGEQVFTIEGADHIYRIFVERMNEGAAVLSSDRFILHCNDRFAELVGIKIQNVIGSSLEDLVWPADRARMNALLVSAAQGPCRGEIQLQSPLGKPLPVRLSLNPLHPGATQAVCLIASDLSEVKHAEQELRTSTEQLRNLAARLLSVREEERTRIAREIHDELGQSLTAVKMDIAWLAGRLPSGNSPMHKRIEATMQLADDLIKSVRRISTELRPGILDLGLVAAVEWQAQEFQTRTGIPCTLQLLDQEEIAPHVSTALFRIVQETFTNVARHAGATNIKVTLEKEGDLLLLRIEDNGMGFNTADPTLSKSLGLLGMRERIAMLGGQLEIASVLGQGTSVTARIPIGSATLDELKV